jgi:hypothetical protein
MPKNWHVPTRLSIGERSHEREVTFSARQLHRTLCCKYETAWFIHHRVMEAMRVGKLDLPPMGDEGQIV